MILEQYYIECLSHASYLIGDETTGRAVVVDPRRDIAEYLDDAAKYGLTIEGVINTHFHADFVSGHLELVEATGAWIGFGEAAETDYPIRRLATASTCPWGRSTSRSCPPPATPGSRSAWWCANTRRQPTAVLTGDSLFIGDVGRPDLVNLGDSSTTDLARAMYHTIHDKLLTLPDDVTVMPAHGAGSSCGKNLSAELTSTIGEQRRTNPSVQPMSEDDIRRADHARAARGARVLLRRRGHEQARPPVAESVTDDPCAQSDADPRTALEDGMRVVDARTVDDFAAGHLRGSVNVGFDGRFAETGGMVADIGDKIALITYPGEEQDAAMRLARVGSDNAIGYLTVDRDGVFPIELSDLVRTSPRITPAELDGCSPRTRSSSVDIRNPGEVELGGIPGAVNIPLAQLRNRLDLLPTDKAIVVHCAGGWRSSVAASLLRASGFDDVSDLAGGYNAWVAAHAIA